MKKIGIGWVTFEGRQMEYKPKEPGDHYRLIETRANNQPAVAVYRTDPHGDIQHASGLLVLGLTGTHISAMTLFPPDTLRQFGLPRTLPL